MRISHTVMFICLFAFQLFNWLFIYLFFGSLVGWLVENTAVLAQVSFPVCVSTIIRLSLPQIVLQNSHSMKKHGSRKHKN